MVGSAIVRLLRARGYANLILRTSTELDLRNQAAVSAFFAEMRPEFVILAAATVGGIHANSTRRAEFAYDNLMIECNVIHAAYEFSVEKLLFLGSTCIYPRDAEQPIRESALLTGPLEESNRSYAVAKIAGIELCQAYRAQYGCSFISAMPCNLYGPGDNYDAHNSHVLAAMIRRFCEAKAHGLAEVECWGTGAPRREFLHVDDLAEACLLFLQHYDDASPINVGSGVEVSIVELAGLVAAEVGYSGAIHWDHSKMDGTPRKVADSQRARELGWKPCMPIAQGVASCVAEFRRLRC